MFINEDFSDQGRTRVFGEAYFLYAAAVNPRPPDPLPSPLPARRAYRPEGKAYASKRERRSGQKGPFMNRKPIRV
jgi:hypothetical protein